MAREWETVTRHDSQARLNTASRAATTLLGLFFGGLLALGPARLLAQSAPTKPILADVSPELLDLVIQDQWDRGNDLFGSRQIKPPASIDWAAVLVRDRERQAAVKELLSAGKVGTAREYQFAAMVFQHSESAENLHLAHVLAVTAVAKGAGHARWLAAATWDRYLQALGQPQVFGTQFKQTSDGLWTAEPYDRTAIPDAVRAEWCVVSLAEQADLLKRAEAGPPDFNTSAAACR